MTEYERDVAKLGEIAKHEAERIKTLEDENAKLRDLCVRAYDCARHSDHATCADCIGMCGGCTLRTAMCELGIEVVCNGQV